MSSGRATKYLDALAKRLGLGEIVQTGVTLELERHAVGQREGSRIPNLQHAGGIGGDNRVVRGGGVHANNVTKMRCGKHDDASVLHGSDRMGVSVASPKQRLGVGGVASSVVDAHCAAGSVAANERRRHWFARERAGVAGPT